ncbi:hypothetical protein A2U01_0087747, partial [Trifolium medium]|nr:hypothetical protein [Trifolium medium]
WMELTGGYVEIAEDRTLEGGQRQPDAKDVEKDAIHIKDVGLAPPWARHRDRFNVPHGLHDDVIFSHSGPKNMPRSKGINYLNAG